MHKNLLIGGGVAVLLLIGSIFFLARRMATTSTTYVPQADTSSTSTDSSEEMAQNTVTIQNFAFSSSTITVRLGDSVSFTNQDSAGHTATADDGSFDTGMLQLGESKTITFNSLGTFSYHCSPHPNMRGKVVVQ